MGVKVQEYDEVYNANRKKKELLQHEYKLYMFIFTSNAADIIYTMGILLLKKI